MMENNFIIHEKACQYQWSGDSFLSIKSFSNGCAYYQVKQRQYVVNENNYLVLNDCTRYNLTVDSSSLTESFCTFFSPSFVAQVATQSNSSDEALLDHSVREKIEGHKIIERIYAQGDAVSGLLMQARNSHTFKTNKIEQEEFYHNLLNLIFQKDRKLWYKANQLRFKKKTTREEIYRRIWYAKDFIDGYYAENLSLKEISEAALMSENHLLRNFSLIVGASPFQYIKQLKLKQAKWLILHTDRGITEIANSLGYSSISNFSYYFKTIFGVSPTSLRKKR